MGFTSKQKDFMVEATTWADTFGKDLSRMTKRDLQDVADSAKMKFPHWITRVPTYKVDRGLWMVPSVNDTQIKPAPATAKPVVEAPAPLALGRETVVAPVVEMTKGLNGHGQTHVPEKDELFVPFGSFPDMVSILKSDMFYPVFVTGLSGNGKTFMIEQACAKAARALYRVNITIETDEDDLLGGFRLVNGETVWFDGPVV